MASRVALPSRSPSMSGRGAMPGRWHPTVGPDREECGNLRFPAQYKCRRFHASHDGSELALSLPEEAPATRYSHRYGIAGRPGRQVALLADASLTTPPSRTRRAIVADRRKDAIDPWRCAIQVAQPSSASVVSPKRHPLDSNAAPRNLHIMEYFEEIFFWRERI
jgi:hypothetical protein